MKIYDCMPFFNELDVLELRLQEHFDKVDYFVIAEANTTHIGNPKEFVFLDNKERFKPYMDKIIHIPVTDMPGPKNITGIHPITGEEIITQNCFPNEEHQRNCITRGLVDAALDDIMILTDLDEIVRPSCIEEMRNDTTHSSWSFRMVYFNYRYNYMWTKPLLYQGGGHQALRIGNIKDFPTLSYFRHQYGCVWANRPSREFDDGISKLFQHGGWHFSSVGDNKHVANKLRNFTDHLEYTKYHQNDAIDIDQLIAAGTSQVTPGCEFTPVIVDDYFPETITKNIDKYQHMIIQGAEKTIMQILEEGPIYNDR